MFDPTKIEVPRVQRQSILQSTRISPLLQFSVNYEIELSTSIIILIIP